MKSENHFEPFGIELPPINSTDNRIKYTNQERDTFTNYDYMHFRFYASSMGRFLKPDNIIPDITNPQNWNAYTYVKGNPVNYNDPSGHSEDQPLQQENKQNQPVGATQPSTQNIEAMKKQEEKMVTFGKKLDLVKKIANGEITQIGSVKFAPSFQKALAKNENMQKAFAAWMATDAGGRMFEKFTKDTNTTFTFKAEKPPAGDFAGQTVASSKDIPVSGPALVDCRQVDIYINPTWYTKDPAMIAGIFVEESIHAESISQGFSYYEYWNIREQLDYIPNYKPDIYWKTQEEAEKILKYSQQYLGR